MDFVMDNELQPSLEEEAGYSETHQEAGPIFYGPNLQDQRSEFGRNFSLRDLLILTSTNALLEKGGRFRC
jgi:hypothetical protein